MTASAEDHLVTLKNAVEQWDSLGWPRPDIAVVAGSGLSVDLGEPAAGPLPLEYFTPFPIHPIEGHPHDVSLLNPCPDRFVVYFQGRLHPYQGYDAHETVFPIRWAAVLGCRAIILTNAAGGLAPGMQEGEIRTVRDHLNLTGLNPLRGQLPASWGPRFPDLQNAYDRRLSTLAHRLAEDRQLDLGEGIYAGVSGPSYETPAEIRVLRLLGADLVGMSTVLEVIAAAHLGIPCLCLSVVSNVLVGPPSPLDHAGVLAATEGAGQRLRELLGDLLASDDLVPPRPESQLP
jgi:purine-nucleoside phosphorylase